MTVFVLSPIPHYQENQPTQKRHIQVYNHGRRKVNSKDKKSSGRDRRFMQKQVYINTPKNRTTPANSIRINVLRMIYALCTPLINPNRVWVVRPCLGLSAMVSKYPRFLLTHDQIRGYGNISTIVLDQTRIRNLSYNFFSFLNKLMCCILISGSKTPLWFFLANVLSRQRIILSPTLFT
jgi:hypothetical protein